MLSMHCRMHILILFFLFGAVAGALDNSLRYYEFIQSPIARRKLIKRNTDGAFRNRVEELQFFAYGRNFHIFLTPKRGLFSSNFKSVEFTDGYDVIEDIDVDQDEFMQGYVSGETDSSVTVNIDEHGAINAFIQLAEDAFTVEPAWRYLENLQLNVSLIYRHSDILEKERDNTNNAFCAIPDRAFPYAHYGWNDTWTSRMKREYSPIISVRVPERNRCSVKLVADYRFYEHIGRKKASLTSRYLINLIDRVNAIYTSTIWRDSDQQSGITNMGFVIKKILIHGSPTMQREHYNSNTTDWSAVDRLLQRFSEAEGSKEYCLVHLFTYQSFPNGVLGLGYVASAKEGTSGGICSAPIVDGRFLYYNTALSSAKSSSGGPVVTREADIVTAHEFGHNWGSPHDLASAECSPPWRSGGSYIMYTYSKFSPCSKRTIKAVLDAKAHLCFQEEEVSFCGNQRVEPGEECDEGLLGEPDGGRCCTSDCKFKANATCSPTNSLCCSASCVFESVGTPCRDGDQNRCLMSSRCDGNSADCPSSSPYPDGTLCLDQGECQNGVCVSFCEKREIGMKPCICENMTRTCYRCCRRSNGSECVPYISASLGRPFVVSNGTRCIRGYCYAGQCVQEATDFVQHLWRIIDRLDGSSFWKFLYDNIVGTIILATLIVWIPASCVVHKWDEKARRERQENLDFIVSNILVSDSDRVTVIQGIKSVPAVAYENATGTAV